MSKSTWILIGTCLSTNAKLQMVNEALSFIVCCFCPQLSKSNLYVSNFACRGDPEDRENSHKKGSHFCYLARVRRKQSIQDVIDGERTLLQNRSLFQAICPGCLWARDKKWLLSRVQRLAGPAGGQGPFVLVGGTNRDQRPPPLLSQLVAPSRDKSPLGPFVPDGATNRD